MKTPADLTALEAAARIEAGSLTAETLVRVCLERISEREPAIDAWQYLDPEQALAAARALDAGPRRGPLHGLPIGVKDLIETFDMPTGYGSAIYAAHRPAWDAAVVALVRRAGGIILGKTVATEFVYFTPGKTRNPHDPTRTPGGSSSGSAAAVAAGMVPLALGTQTAGSVVRPASFCGVVGYKPTYGLIDVAGVRPFAWSLDTIGIFTRTVADAAFLIGEVSGRDLCAAMPLDTPPRVGMCRTPQWPAATPATAAAFEEAGKRLAAAGAALREVTLPAEFDDLLEAQMAVIAFETARAFAFERFRNADRLSAKFKELLEAGAAIPPETYDRARQTAWWCRGRLDAAFGDSDVLLTPSAPGEAPALETTGDPVFNRIWTLLGTPCVNVPGFVGPNGLPVGVQVVGRLLDDARTLAASEWIAGRLVA